VGEREIAHTRKKEFLGIHFLSASAGNSYQSSYLSLFLNIGFL
jgi:hypothetical protein